MNNLYHKVAVTSIGIALSLAFGANKKVKAATFTLTATPFFIGGASDIQHSQINRFESISYVQNLSESGSSYYDIRAFYEFNIGNLFLDTNTVIRRAILKTPLSNFQRGPFNRSLTLVLSGYVGNGRPDLSDFYAGVGIANENAFSLYPGPGPLDEVNFNVTNFINQQVSNGDDFAGLGISVQGGFRSTGRVDLQGYYGQKPSLIIETVDVPEPTTIFGSALALGVGGWLKRKKSSQQNKTTSQH
jgi:hypothetical protein